MSPDDGFDDIALHLGRHVPGQGEVTVKHVVTATPIVVTNGMALGAVADRLLTVVAHAALREARHGGSLLRRTAAGAVAQDRHLRYGQEQVDQGDLLGRHADRWLHLAGLLRTVVAERQ